LQACAIPEKQDIPEKEKIMEKGENPAEGN
jgi:hypothetical protein